MSSKQLYEKMRPSLLAKYELIDDDVPGCFGTKPPSNDSAFFQGCLRCDYGGKCYEATQTGYDDSMLPDEIVKLLNQLEDLKEKK